MDVELIEKCLDDFFSMKEKTVEWSSVLSCYIRAYVGKVVSCHVFTDDRDSCFVHIHVHYCREDITINVYALQKGKPTDLDDFAYNVLKIWKTALEEECDLEGHACNFARRADLYEFCPNNDDLKKVVFVNGELQTDLGTF